MATFKGRLKALEAKMAQENLVLSKSQLAALERAKLAFSSTIISRLIPEEAFYAGAARAAAKNKTERANLLCMVIFYGANRHYGVESPDKLVYHNCMVIKKKNIYTVMAILAIAVLLVLPAACLNLKGIAVHSPNLNTIADGTYRGSSKVGPVRVVLDVTVKANIIVSIDLIRHFNGLGKKAEAIIPTIIKTQNLDVDVVSGATGSSKAILLAVENALAGKRQQAAETAEPVE